MAASTGQRERSSRKCVEDRSDGDDSRFDHPNNRFHIGQLYIVSIYIDINGTEVLKNQLAMSGKKHSSPKGQLSHANWISFRLRHDADLLTEPSGWVDLERLARLSPDYPRRSIEEIITGIVTTSQHDKKGRYELDGTRIRATNGHSVRLTQPVMRRINIGENFEWAVHGTNTSAWTKIQSSGGLSRMTRDYVHFAVECVHFRPSSQVDIHLYLDVESMLRDGHALFMTTNGVLASVDDVPLRYLTVGKRPVL